MKKVKMMYLKNCPYCKQAFAMVEELKKINPDFCAINIEIIEEKDEEEKTIGYDYWYVPCYFVDDEKILEGVPTAQMIKEVLEKALA